MEKGSLKNILNLIKTDKRYWLVFSGLILIVLFGQSTSLYLDSPTQTFPVHSRSIGGYVLERNQASFILKDIINAKSDEYYRVNFSLKTEEDTLKSTFSDSNKIENVGIDLSLVSLSGDKQIVQKFELPKDGEYHQFEIVFKSNGRGNDLELNRTDKLILDKMEMGQRITVTKLNIRNDIERASLNPSIIGSISSLAKSEIESPAVVYSFKKKNSVAGQIFLANGSGMSSVSLRMHFQGNGGSGKYRLALAEAEYKDGEYLIGKDDLAFFDFDASTAEGIYQVDPSQELYQFPLSSKLENGKYYFVTVDNKSASASFMHHLQLFGTSDKNAYADGAAIVAGKEQKEIGVLAFEVFGMKHDEPIGELQDLGGGEGLYSYSLDPEGAGLSELYQTSGNDLKVNYDPVNKAVIASAENNNSLLYRFDTKHPFKKIGIQAEQVSGDYYGSKLEYSFDGNEWEDIANREEESLPDNFSVSLKGNGQNSIVYLKITYNKEDEDYKPLKFFGLRSLDVNAELFVK